jgi:hypothetical protein
LVGLAFLLVIRVAYPPSAEQEFFYAVRCNTGKSWSDGQISNAKEIAWERSPLMLKFHNPNIDRMPVTLTAIWLNDGKNEIARNTFEISSHDVFTLNSERENISAVRLIADRCFTPLNEGISRDSRRLAMQIISPPNKQ